MSYELETIDCPLCASSNWRIYIKNARDFYNDTNNFFNLVKCLDCGFVFTNPRPTRETISFFYPDSAGYYQPRLRANKKHSGREKIIKTIITHYYGYRFEPLYGRFVAFVFKSLFSQKLAAAHIPYYIPAGKLLDIGCSWGSFLSRMASYGWDVYGIETNEKAADYAKNTSGLQNIFNGFFEDYKCPDDFFNVVQMSMVLEHLHEPQKCLERVYKIMKKGGQLILSVPDITGFEVKLYGKYTYTLHVPQHLNHFSPATITDLLNRTGFEVERIVHQNFDKDMVASADYLNNKILAKILHIRLLRKTIIKSFVFLLSLLGKTGRMTVYARKKMDKY